jgi:hypothetical protein
MLIEWYKHRLALCFRSDFSLVASHKETRSNELEFLSYAPLVIVNTGVA